MKPLADLTDAEAVELFQSLGAQYFGLERFPPRFAMLCGITPRAVNQWAQTRPPQWAILLLQARIESDQKSADLNQIAKAFKLMQKIADQSTG